MPDTKRLDAFPVEDLLSELRVREDRQQDAPTLETAQAGVELAEFDTQSIVEALRAQQKVIYGTDDRQDVFQVTDPSVLADADSVVALFSAASVTDNGDGTSTLQTQDFGTSENLCITEPFRDQPVGAFCSGFLVAPDVIATAGHCVDAANVTGVRFVFGFRMVDPTTARTTIEDADVYRGVSLVGRQLTSNGTDWALVRLDRAVPNHPVVGFRRSGRIPDGQAVHVIGHPAGLPMKIAAGASVRDNAPAAFFVANLDTYGGNSGSPVFNSDTHEVEGVLVRGETDFVQQGSCTVSLVCPATGCRGEDCTRTTEFANLLATPVAVPDA